MSDAVVPAYWEAACEHLMACDPVMRELVTQHRGTTLTARGDAFTTLARSVVGQQISVKAAAAIWGRLTATCDEVVSPQQLLLLSPSVMRDLGLSARKVEYLLDLAHHFTSEKFQGHAWSSMPDEAIVQELVAIRGIGRWTAEMFLMFHLLRPNVLPLDDLGLIRGVERLYFEGRPVRREALRQTAKPWHPYCSVATWYIWRNSEPLPVNH